MDKHVQDLKQLCPEKLTTAESAIEMIKNGSRIFHCLKKESSRIRTKKILPDRAVATLCMGSKNIYDYIDKNPRFYFRSSDFVNDPLVIARNDNFISISSALEVDLSGQVCSDSIDNLFFSGSGDQANFIRGAAMSKGGFSIVALPSTAKGGTQSRIVPYFSQGELEKIAIENGFKGFTAYLLANNKAMLHVLSKRYPNAKKSHENGSVLLIIDFNKGTISKQF